MSECKFRTAYSPLTTRPHVVGDRVEKIYRKKRDQNGNAYYEVHGEIDIISNIQSYKNGCALQYILDRISLMPLKQKVTQLSHIDPAYADMTAFPKDGYEAFKALDDLNRKYPGLYNRVKNGESLEVALKALFGGKDKNNSKQANASDTQFSENGKKDGDN